ncbi:MAG: 16S rRNA (adenine(1518)-N(6)/adenine(1519)-N(6))-dimethyltransferase RsmA [Acholeplasmataceae bacterium]
MHRNKKRFGQNFIKDSNLINKIVELAEVNNKNILEIGPGRGALTKPLISNAKKYLAYEIDYTLKPILEKFKSDNTNFYFKDFLSNSTSDEIDAYFNNEDVYLVSNLPYNITTPVIFKFFELKNLKEATLMVQKEVGERMISNVGNANYSSFTVVLNYYVEVTKLLDVNRNMFKPVPKVDSVVVKLTKKEERLPINIENIFLKLIKQSFIHRRKKLINNLENFNNHSKEDIIKYFIKLKFNENIRAQELKLEDYINLAHLLA